jgi:hypothetical protein
LRISGNICLKNNKKSKVLKIENRKKRKAVNTLTGILYQELIYLFLLKNQDFSKKNI